MTIKLTADLTTLAKERITEDFIERMLEDIPRMLQKVPDGGGYAKGAAQEAHRSAYRREMRRRIIERLSE